MSFSQPKLTSPDTVKGHAHNKIIQFNIEITEESYYYRKVGLEGVSGGQIVHNLLKGGLSLPEPTLTNICLTYSQILPRMEIPQLSYVACSHV